MSFEVPTTAVIEFNNNMQLLLNQKKPILWEHIPAVTVAGEKCDITDFLGHAKAQKGDDRHGDTKYNNTPHDRVWMTKPVEAYYAELVDRQDQLAAKIALTSGYMMTAAATVARAKDDAVLAGIYGSIISGKNGTTVTAFPGGMIVPVTVGGAAGAQRMNVDKLRFARKVLAQQYNDMQAKRHIVFTAEQNDDMLKEVPVTSSDFKSLGGRVENGKLVEMLGFTIHEMELGNPLLDSAALSVDGSNYRKNPFWVEGGVVKGAWEELFTDISPLPQKRHSRQVYASTTVAATRTQAGMVGIILNSEA